MLSTFQYSAPETRITYGAGCVGRLRRDLERAGCRRAVILSGHTLARSEPGVATIRAALGDLCAATHDGVTEHSPQGSVLAIVDLLREVEADALIAVGGGSAIVSARAAAIILGENKHPSEICTIFETGKPPRSPRLSASKIPQFIVPTTPTTAYAKAGAAIAGGGAGPRLSLFDPKGRAKAIYFDSQFFAETPRSLIRDSALNAFVIGVQGLESNSRQPLTDALLLQGVRLIRANLALVGNSSDTAVRGELMLAALMVGQGTDVSGGGLATAIGHSVGARVGAPNGIVNAIVLPHTLRFNFSETRERLSGLAEILGLGSSINQAAEMSAACADFFAGLGVPARLRDVGVARDDLPSICEVASHDWFYTQNPRHVTPEACLELLHEAW